jgi:hypothetical protein
MSISPRLFLFTNNPDQLSIYAQFETSADSTQGERRFLDLKQALFNCIRAGRLPTGTLSESGNLRIV